MSEPVKTGALSRALMSCGAMVAMFSSVAFAQETAPAPAAEEAAIDEIVVYGSIVSAQGAAIAEKRDSDKIIDVVSADSVGRFPDQNSAAALSRLPAVAVQRDQGQERYVQVRGAPNRYVSVTVDGVPVIGVDEGGATRAFRFDAIPSVLLSSAAVEKSLTPDLTAEAVVANVDLRTYAPLGTDGFDLQGEAGLGFMELGDGEQRQGSLRGAWANDRFGFVIGGSHYRREQVTDNREVGAYTASRVPTELDIRNYQLIRENNGLFAGAQLQATPSLVLSANAIFTEFLDTEDRDQYEFRLDRASNFAGSGRGGDLVNVPVRASYNQGDYATQYYIYTLGGDYEKDAWDVSARLNLTETENTTFLPLIQASTASSQNVSLNYDFSEPNFPVVTLFTTIPGVPPTRGTALDGIDQAFPGGSINYIAAKQDSFSDSITAKLDVARNAGAWTYRGGVSYADRALDGFVFAVSNGAVLTGRINLADYVTDEAWSTQFPLGISFTEMDNGRLRRDALAAAIGAPSFVPGQVYDPANDVPATNRYDLTEELLAAYGMVEREFDRGQIVFGVRVENFSSSNSGTARVGSALEPLTFDQEYTDLFPSLNVRYDLKDNLVLRLAGQRTLARPSFGEVRISAAINDTLNPGTISGGNPALDPEYIWGLDASLEYYPTRNSILSVSVYHRIIDNVLFSTTQAVGSDAFDSNGVDRSNHLLTATFNGDDGTLTGLEFNYQQQFDFLPGAWSGLGFQGNLALLDGEFNTPQREGIPLPGTSETIVNASLYYEKFGFSGRVSYQWRDNWLDTLGGLGVGSTGDEFRRAYENLDVTLRYQITDNFTAFADLANLTDETYVAFLGAEDQPTEVEQIGSRYLFGVRFNY